MAAAACLLLGACAVAPTDDGIRRDWQQHREALSALVHWEFSGRIALRSAKGQESARMRWSQQGSGLRVEASGPLGVGQRVLERKGGQTRLLQNGKWRHLDKLKTAAELGWPLPLEQLSWWLRGIPAPDEPPAQTRLDGDRLARLEQSGWTLEYREYKQVGGLHLPGRITFSGRGIEGKILLKRWTLGPDT